ncbi:hypothetical protein SS50377_22031 [Spironucleus salmonicida]|uniref:MMS19 nucleotide excision repair protein n=1 Tax=Spironucleus salmonicida TaxID=348837 RepID=V6LYC4_9EUKA|nr:hypothetical protein SS50377_22031 [Spironucleus salmonicida]|eukprot:EST45804.1 hypothetical protein SS50377_14378 [Spironucleus salmonicida]
MYPTITQEEIKQAIHALQLNIKSDLKQLSQVQINKITVFLSSSDEEIQGFSALLCFYFSAIPSNLQHIILSSISLLRDCSGSVAAFARQYAILTLARAAELDHSALSGMKLIEQIAGFAGQQLSEEAFDAPAVFIAKYYQNYVESEEVYSKTALQLLVYLCQRIHGSLGEEDFGQIFVILEAMQSVLQYPQFKAQSLAARLPTTLVTYLSSLLNSSITPSRKLVISIFKTLSLAFTELNFPTEFTENEEFLHFLDQETTSLSQMDLFGIIRFYCVPESTVDLQISEEILKFFAVAMKIRSFAEDAFNHMENKGSRSTVQICQYISFVLINSDNQHHICQYLFEITASFCQFRHVSEKIATSNFLPLVKEYLNFVINKKCVIEHKNALFALFELISILCSDSFNFIDSTKLFFEDFQTSQVICLKVPGQNLYNLFDILVEIADLTEDDQFLYQQNLNAIFSLSQLSISLMPFLHSATSLDLLRKKFKTVRPSRIPPCSIMETRALIHLINQRRSIKFAAIIPFGLRMLCKLDDQATLIVSKKTLQNLNNLIDWVCSEDNNFSRVNFSVMTTRQPNEEISDETLLMQNKAVKGFLPEVIQEVLGLLNVLVFNKIVDSYAVANILNSWVHITSVDQIKAEEGSVIVRAVCKSLGHNFSKVKGGLNKNILKLVE